MNRYTKIICTLGPVSNTEEMIIKMAQRGMNVARVNCSHGSDEQHQKMIDWVRCVNQKNNFNVTVLIDLAGYRIRIGDLKKKIFLNKDDIVYLSNEPDDDPQVIPFDYKEDLKDVPKGSLVFIDDGLLHLKVLDVSSKKFKLRVVQGGWLKEHKGVNIPALKLHSNLMTAQDEQDINFAIKNKVEKIAQSFVRNKKDIQRVVDMVKPRLPDCKIIAKIESEGGVRNVDSIIDACDGVMVARGDLGVTLSVYKVPMVQKYIIRRCNRKKKLSITATQMLESMIESGNPTRAEVSDVANAILDGTDYVMLSGETAVGKYPSRSIKVMSQIIEYTEKQQDFRL
ncbi:MAG: pyruvate kinase [Candidatus Omnitrophota bacterium]|nr:pyruvate kinase [Candidatus Omnitrophota bacterium]